MTGNKRVPWPITKQCRTCRRVFSTLLITELCATCDLEAARAREAAEQQRQRKAGENSAPGQQNGRESDTGNQC